MLLPPFGTSSSSYYSTLDFPPVLCSPTEACFPALTISGTIFLDGNGDGIKDPLEEPFLIGLAEAQPGDNLSSTDQNGRYGIPVQPGMYSLQGRMIPYYQITTPVHNVSLSAGEVVTMDHDVGYAPIPGTVDIVVEIIADPARPGFDNSVYLQVKSVGTQATFVDIDLSFDTVQAWIDASVLPDLQNANNVGWNVMMNPGDCWAATVTLNTPVSAALGTLIQHQLMATPSSSDSTPADNVDIWDDTVVGSYDPNDKLSSVSTLTENQVQSGAWVDYTVRFQNTGTFPAENVLVTDTLPQELQASTFAYVASSHPNFWYLEEGVLHVRYDGIQLLDSNANEPASHGFVKFCVQPETALVAGEQVTNTANIYFDFNEPVITDPNVITIGPEDILLNTRMFLGGCYDDATGLMRDDLRMAQLIPSTEPYTAFGYIPVGPQPGDSIDGGVLAMTGNNAIVDWVIVELRNSTNNAQVVASRFGLIQRDGDIVDMDGVSSLAFAAPADHYYVAFRHRNHLGVLSGLQYMVGMTPISVDLTYPQTPSYGTDARQNINGMMVMWAGNVDFNDELKYTGSDNDRDPILVNIGGVVPSNTRPEQLP